MFDAIVGGVEIFVNQTCGCFGQAIVEGVGCYGALPEHVLFVLEI